MKSAPGGEVKTIFQEWQSYAREVVPPNAPEVQREECRRAFYAGAMAAFTLTLAACEPDDEAVCEANLKRLDSEIRSITGDLSMPHGTR